MRNRRNFSGLVFLLVIFLQANIFPTAASINQPLKRQLNNINDDLPINDGMYLPFSENMVDRIKIEEALRYRTPGDDGNSTSVEDYARFYDSPISV